MASAAEMHSPGVQVKDIREIPRGTHMFFDDDETNVQSVKASIQKYNETHPSDPPISLEAFYCPPDPGNLSLINSAGDRVPVENVKSYITNKISGKKISGESVLSEPLRELLFKAAAANPKPNPSSVSKGLTLEMIEKIIDFEGKGSEKKGLSKFFFDFDGLLTLVQKVPIFEEVHETTAEIEGLAKYLFSDHIGEEPSTGRLTRLKKMFRRITPERAYIITNNGLALNSGKNPNHQNFCLLVKQLLPDFDITHIKMSNYKEGSEIVSDKGRAIITFLRPASASVSSGGPASASGSAGGGMKRSKFRKTYRNRKSLSRARKMRSHKHNIAAHNKRRHSKKSKK
jgi:hypothetical protein